VANSQERFRANFRRCTPTTQIAGNGSQAVYNALDLEARIAEVQQQACGSLIALG
jgi:hypothetical protein